MESLIAGGGSETTDHESFIAGLLFNITGDESKKTRDDSHIAGTDSNTARIKLKKSGYVFLISGLESNIPGDESKKTGDESFTTSVES